MEPRKYLGRVYTTSNLYEKAMEDRFRKGEKAMTVAEIIAELKKFDQNLEVMSYHRGMKPIQEVTSLARYELGKYDCVVIQAVSNQ